MLLSYFSSIKLLTFFFYSWKKYLNLAGVTCFQFHFILDDHKNTTFCQENIACVFNHSMVLRVATDQLKYIV